MLTKIRLEELGPSDDGPRAIGELNELKVEERRLQVTEARPQESRGGNPS